MKWTGTIICALIVVTFMVSLWWSVVCFRYTTWPWAAAGAADGTVFCFVLNDNARRAPPPLVPDELVVEPGGRGLDSSFLWPESFIDSTAMGTALRTPLWMPFLLAIVPTLLLWRLDRRRTAPGHCRRCGYDLTGLTSGRCPECGLAAGPPSGHG